MARSNASCCIEAAWEASGRLDTCCVPTPKAPRLAANAAFPPQTRCKIPDN